MLRLLGPLRAEQYFVGKISNEYRENCVDEDRTNKVFEARCNRCNRTQLQCNANRSGIPVRHVHTSVIPSPKTSFHAEYAGGCSNRSACS